MDTDVATPHGEDDGGVCGESDDEDVTAADSVRQRKAEAQPTYEVVHPQRTHSGTDREIGQSLRDQS